MNIRQLLFRPHRFALSDALERTFLLWRFGTSPRWCPWYVRFSCRSGCYARSNAASSAIVRRGIWMFSNDAFERVPESWKNPDFTRIFIHSYRQGAPAEVHTRTF